MKINILEVLYTYTSSDSEIWIKIIKILTDSNKYMCTLSYINITNEAHLVQVLILERIVSCNYESL